MIQKCFHVFHSPRSGFKFSEKVGIKVWNCILTWAPEEDTAVLCKLSVESARSAILCEITRFKGTQEMGGEIGQGDLWSLR